MSASSRARSAASANGREGPELEVPVPVPGVARGLPEGLGPALSPVASGCCGGSSPYGPIANR